MTQLRRHLLLFVRGSVAFRGGWGDLEHPLRLCCLSKGRRSSLGRKGKNSLKRSSPGLYFGMAESPASQQSCQNCRDPRGSAHRNETYVFASIQIIRIFSNLLLPSLHRSSGRWRAERGGWGALSQGGGRAAGPRVLGLLSRCPPLTHLMLFHHFTEAGIPLRDPSVKLGDSHFDRQS